MKQNNRAVALDSSHTPAPSGGSFAEAALHDRDRKDGSHAPAICRFGERCPKTRHFPDGLGRTNGRGSVHPRRHRAPAREEGFASAQAHPPGCPHVRRASDAKGPRRAVGREASRLARRSATAGPAPGRRTQPFHRGARRNRQGHDAPQSQGAARALIAFSPGRRGRRWPAFVPDRDPARRSAVARPKAACS